MYNFINNKIIIIFFLILILILLQGLSCRPAIGIHFYEAYNFCSKSFFLKFWQENGFVENLQSFLLFVSIIYLFKARIKFKDIKLINFFLIVKIFALIYYLGEEISWGQHFFRWESPSWFMMNNNQNETNFHNTSNFLDQLPRSLVLIWCSLSSIFVIFYNKIKKIDINLFKILCPDKKIIFIAFTLIVLSLPDLLLDKLNLKPETYDAAGELIKSAYYYDMFSFNFIRLSELHEFIFSSYFMIYSWYFYNSKRSE